MLSKQCLDPMIKEIKSGASLACVTQCMSSIMFDNLGGLVYLRIRRPCQDAGHIQDAVKQDAMVTVIVELQMVRHTSLRKLAASKL